MTKRDELDASVAELAAAADGSAGACPEESSWIDLARAALPPAEAERLREHLAGCVRCVETARDADRFLTAMGAAGARERAAPLGRRLAWIAALLLAVAGVSWWLDFPARRADPLSRWAAGPVAPPRAFEGTVEDELVFRGGEPAAPSAAAELARGYELLAAGRAAEARTPLAAAAAAGDSELAAEARWYLVLALLRSGDRAGAAAALVPLRGRSGPRAKEVEALAAVLAGRR